jgi:hypothetical protein
MTLKRRMCTEDEAPPSTMQTFDPLPKTLLMDRLAECLSEIMQKMIVCDHFLTVRCNIRKVVMRTPFTK